MAANPTGTDGKMPATGEATGAKNGNRSPRPSLSPEQRRERRQSARSWWNAEKSEQPAGLTGLALSGGGIRSATFSLGVIQALAKNDALSRIDILSTVSGGTYIGCFLRSLFLPMARRGAKPADQAPDSLELEDQADFAERALTSEADQKEIRGPGNWGKVRNPIWWLREHSRYLAPNGPIDYVYGVALIARNWFAMLYIFLLAMTAIMTLVIGMEAVVAGLSGYAFDWTWLPLPAADATESGDAALRLQRDSIAWRWSLRPPPSGPILPVSPIFPLVLLPAAASAVTSVAYWMTQAMSPNEPELRRQWRNLIKAFVGMLGGILIIGLALVLLPSVLNRPALPPPALWMVDGLLLLCAGGVLVALITALFTALGYRHPSRVPSPELVRGRRQLFTAELRRRLTKGLAISNQIALLLIVFGLIDSAGAWLRHWYWKQSDVDELIAAVMLPLFAYLIRKLPDWLKDGKSRVAVVFRRFLSPAALVAGLVLFGALAVVATAVVHAAIWTGESWQTTPDTVTGLVFAGVVATMAVLAGTATGFINLSSLHGYYASRLTRAYLGASNAARLSAAAEGGVRIFDNHEADFIQPRVYAGDELLAPIHIINATLNETVDLQSQVVARDRKGDLFSIEPGGVRTGAGGKLVPWGKLGDPACAEQLSLGQWCAISGASASPGMGRLTSLGLALALTFANFRLGYWWWSPDVSSKRDELRFAPRWLDYWFGTFVYLWNEMTARYSRGYARKYLSDGGHYENSGAYALIGRRVPLILVIDAGADPDYRFADLENLVRKARLDLGAEISILSGDRLKAWSDAVGCKDPALFVDPAELPDWRSAFADPESSAGALALRVQVAAKRGQPGSERELTMIWIKPRSFSGMPPDVAGYAAANPDFPQQTTRDQFFDESQWESYRRLGEVSLERLLLACPRLLN